MKSAIECAFIQTKNGVPEREPFYRAWDGLKKLSIACHFFEETQLQRGELPLTRRSLVVGGIPVMEARRDPDPKVIKAAVADFQPTAPAGYGIDFGVLSDGRTVLVEANEGYSLNPYGLEAVDYAELLIARWQQLMR